MGRILRMRASSSAWSCSALALSVTVVGCSVSPLPSSACVSPDLASTDAGNVPCGAKSEPTSSTCPWVCTYSNSEAYVWVAIGCCSPASSGDNAGDDTPCGPLGARSEPCAWRCTYDPRIGGGYQWQVIYVGCSLLD